LEFKDECVMDVCAFDQPGYQTDTDSTTGGTILPHESNELLGGVVGVIWSEKHVTMTRVADKSRDPNEIFLRNFAQLITLCPEGCTSPLKTHSSWLVEQWDRMIQWGEN
jgi:hypothetical protein